MQPFKGCFRETGCNPVAAAGRSKAVFKGLFILSKMNQAKNLLAILLLAILFQGCMEKRMTKREMEKEFVIYEIDSCEYLGKSVGTNVAIFTHKGNCKFCEQRKNK